MIGRARSTGRIDANYSQSNCAALGKGTQLPLAMPWEGHHPAVSGRVIAFRFDVLERPRDSGNDLPAV
jgi:hypothetical protein